MNIDEMEAGRELDALVGKYIFDTPQWCPKDDDEPFCKCNLTRPGTIHLRTSCPHFSVEDEYAFQVVDKLIAEGWSFQLSAVPLAEIGTRWVARFVKLDLEWRGVADTRPLAICRAAPKAVMREGEPCLDSD